MPHPPTKEKKKKISGAERWCLGVLLRASLWAKLISDVSDSEKLLVLDLQSSRIDLQSYLNFRELVWCLQTPSPDASAYWVFRKTKFSFFNQSFCGVSTS